MAVGASLGKCYRVSGLDIGLGSLTHHFKTLFGLVSPPHRCLAPLGLSIAIGRLNAAL